MFLILGTGIYASESESEEMDESDGSLAGLWCCAASSSSEEGLEEAAGTAVACLRVIGASVGVKFPQEGEAQDEEANNQERANEYLGL